MQEINVKDNNLSVREEILRPGGPPGIVSVEAQFDGKDYPVNGSPFAEVIAYTREGTRIVGTTYKNGSVCLRETIVCRAGARTDDAAILDFLWGKRDCIWSGGLRKAAKCL